MELHARESLLQDVADGRVSLRDVGGLSTNDVFAIARVGAAAMQGGRFAQAAEVFSALIALEPACRVHHLHLAYARQGANDVDGAIAAVTAAIDMGAGGDDGAADDSAADDSAADDSAADVARALLLRAELRGRTDREAAIDDLTRAQALTSPSARRIVDAALGARR